MRICSTVLLLLVSFATASAVANPNVFVYVDFDPPNMVHRVDPEPYDVVEAYLMIDCVPDGFLAICFAVDVTPESSFSTSFGNLMPNPGAIAGDYESGIVIGSLSCVHECPIPFTVARIVYTGTPGDVVVTDHPEWPRWVVDCNDPLGSDPYCLLSNGGIGKDPIPTGEMCGCPTPVEDESWGTIKAMFR